MHGSIDHNSQAAAPPSSPLITIKRCKLRFGLRRAQAAAGRRERKKKNGVDGER
jgi:hypothetical protein